MKVCVSLIIAVCMTCSAWGGDNWPDFRGPGADGHSDSTGLPLDWSETKNVKWKVPIHDLGYSTPVVWGDQIWITTAENQIDGGFFASAAVAKRSFILRTKTHLYRIEKP